MLFHLSGVSIPITNNGFTPTDVTSHDEPRKFTEHPSDLRAWPSLDSCPNMLFPLAEMDGAFLHQKATYGK